MRRAILVMAALLSIGSASAYIDPGTGGMIIGSIWPMIMAFFVAIGAFFGKYLISPVKSVFAKVFGLGRKDKE